MRRWMIALAAVAATVSGMTAAGGAVDAVVTVGNTYNVNTAADSPTPTCSPAPSTATCNLRGAWNEANSHSGSLINVPPGIYVLLLADGGELASTSGTSITLTGADPNKTFIDGGGTNRVFDVTFSNANLQLHDVTIQHGGGVSQGAGVYNSGSLATEDVRIVSNTTTSGGSGGGIFNSGSANLTDTVFSKNDASSTGSGGGLFNEFSATLSYTTFTGNHAEFGGGLDNDFNVTASWSTFSNNVADCSTQGQGGAIYNSVLGFEFIGATFGGSHLSIHDNTAYDGGGFYNLYQFTSANDAISHNLACHDGGGFYSTSVGCECPLFGATHLTNEKVTSNRADYAGGGFYNTFLDVLSMTNSLIACNHAGSGPSTSCAYGASPPGPGVSPVLGGGDGGGFYNETFIFNVPLSIVALEGNQADRDGGGFYNNAALHYDYSMIKGNKSGADGGGGYNAAYRSLVMNDDQLTGNVARGNGGGVNNNGTFTLSHDTITFNHAGGIGGGIHDDASGALTYGPDSAIVNNTPDNVN